MDPNFQGNRTFKELRVKNIAYLKQDSGFDWRWNLGLCLCQRIPLSSLSAGVGVLSTSVFFRGKHKEGKYVVLYEIRLLVLGIFY